MKILRLLFLSGIVLLASCKEDYIGQFPVDGIAPKQVTAVQVENLPGTVRIKYELPDEADLLYVKAIYTSSLGVRKEVRASVFSNVLVIPGFGRSKKDTIQLISVDRSQNESVPVPVEIEPEDSPIYAIGDSMKVSNAFGGIKFKWKNPMKAQIITAVYRELNGQVILMNNFYSSVADFTSAIRGLDSINYNIAIVVKDTYGNVTDTLKKTQKPLFEAMLPSATQFKELALSLNYKISVWSGTWSTLWDGKKGTISSGVSCYYLDIANPPQPYFTFDLGKSYILSRMKIWQRLEYAYVLHNPRYFEIWGTNDINVGLNAESFDGWTRIGNFQSKKPSGNDENATITAEDKVFVAAGEEFEFEDMQAPVRYIRFRSIQNWTKTNAIHIAEMEFYGQEKQ
jgi:hypothetical protein